MGYCNRSVFKPTPKKISVKNLVFLSIYTTLFPDVRFSCAFPFEFQGVLYYECITFDHPIRRDDTPWCSIDPVYSNRWINCDSGNNFGCVYMNDLTGNRL